MLAASTQVVRTVEARKCSFTHPDGRGCSAPPRRNSERCAFHPTTEAGRATLRDIARAGWRAASAENRALEGHALGSEDDVVHFQQLVLDHLVTGKLGPTESRAAVELARSIYEGRKRAAAKDLGSSSAKLLAKVTRGTSRSKATREGGGNRERDGIEASQSVHKDAAIGQDQAVAVEQSGQSSAAGEVVAGTAAEAGQPSSPAGGPRSEPGPPLGDGAGLGGSPAPEGGA